MKPAEFDWSIGSKYFENRISHCDWFQIHINYGIHHGSTIAFELPHVFRCYYCVTIHLECGRLCVKYREVSGFYCSMLYRILQNRDCALIAVMAAWRTAISLRLELIEIFFAYFTRFPRWSAAKVQLMSGLTQVSWHNIALTNYNIIFRIYIICSKIFESLLKILLFNNIEKDFHIFYIWNY